MTDSLLTRRSVTAATANDAALQAHDAELARVLEAYLADVEAGQAPSAGELVAAHPHLAERLEACLASLAFVEQAGGEMGAAALVDCIDDPLADERATLGDFRLLREIGRGGMGIVYEAEQLSLARRVAVKVLPFAAMLDQRQLARFKNEARAAAGLHHGHIVPVYYVGAERGVHFYAMQYIEGKSLGEMRISDCGLRNEDGVDTTTSPNSALRTPHSALDTQPLANVATLPDLASPAHFRRIAELGVQAAEALHYAHESGVVHRDVKPSNLLVECSHLAPRDEASTKARGGSEFHHAERDDYHLWVADFGLARIGADATLTVTGDLVGTLRYMSPEQLRGKAAMVDHRTDVYSLGVTLYELVTGRPAFTAESSEQLLNQILNAEPPAPRTVNRAIPGDLETIVLKAICKDASDRYATAQDLADDLRRLLDAKPIVARRPTLVDRAVMWARRHASLVAVGVTSLAAIAVVSLVASMLTLRAYRSESRERARAEANLLLAAESIDRMLSRVASDHRTAGDFERAETLAVDATEFYEKLLRRSDNPDLVFQAAAAYEQVAVVWTLIEQYEKAGRAHRRAKELLTPLAVPSGREAHQAAMAQNYMGQADIALSLRQDAAAEAPTQHALAIYEQLARQFPQDAQYDVQVADALGNLGLIAWLTGRLDEAEVLFARATAVETGLPERLKAAPDYWQDRGATLNNWGMLVCERGEYDRALQMFEDSIALQRRAFDAWKTDPVQHNCYRLAHWNIAATHAAAEDYAAALAAVERLLSACPGHLDTYHDSAVLLLECAKHVGDDADAYRRRARELLALGLAAPVQSLDARERLAWLLANCEDPSFRDLPQAVELAGQVVNEAPERGAAWYTLAWAHYRSGDWPAAELALENAVRYSVEGRATADDWLLLAMIRWQQGQTVEGRKWLAKARASATIPRGEQQLFDVLAQEASDLIKSPAENSTVSASAGNSPSTPSGSSP